MIYISMKTDRGLTSKVRLRKITSEVRLSARRKFAGAVQKGTVEGGFDADIWRFRDEAKETVNLRFSYRKEELQETAEKAGTSRDVIISDLKTYLALLYGVHGLERYRELAKYTIDELIASKLGREKAVPSGKSHGSLLAHYVEFLQVMETEIPKDYIELCEKELTAVKEELANRDHSGPCRLAEFSSYFTLDHCLTEFWKEADQAEKNRYYPLYLFWITTTVLPLRVKEFLVTPTGCIREKNGKYWITIRRSRLKGSSARNPKIHGYTIDTDYTMEICGISDDVAEEFLRYMDITKDMSHPYGLLLSRELHMKGSGPDQLFDIKDLGEMLQDFYREVVCGRYGYTLVTEDELLKRSCINGSYEIGDREVMMIHPKHTRHLALINLILRGCNPSVIKTFAGHASEVMSANYYQNTVNLVRCAVKRMYVNAKTSRGKTISFVPGSTPNALQRFIDRSRESVEMDGGKCYSKRFISGDLSDCTQCDGKCITCPSFVPASGNKDLKQRDDQDIDSELQYLVRLLKSESIEAKIDEYTSRMNRLEALVRESAVFTLRQLWKENYGTETDIQ